MIAELASTTAQEANTAAQHAKDLAETAANNALGAANVYASTALGLAGTAEGDYFSVPATDNDLFLSMYRKVSGAAVFVASNYSTAKVDALEAQLGDLRDASALSATANAAGLISVQALIAPTISFA